MNGSMKDVTRKTLLTLVASMAQEENLLLEILLEEDELKDLQAPQKKSRHIYERPDYQKSVWWTLLQKGDCKDPFNRQYMVFRRRFGIPFDLFKL